MTDKRLQDFYRETVEELLRTLRPKERLKGLSPEERLKGLSAQEVLRALCPQAREELARQLKANGSSVTPQ